MAIYKSSFNKKPEKPEKKQKQEKPKEEKIKADKPKKKINASIVWLFIFVALFTFSVLPAPFDFMKNFLMGAVGLLIYPITIIGAFISLMTIKKRNYNIKKRYIVYLTFTLLIIWFIFHLILTSRLPDSSYGTFLKETYMAKTTAGGIIFSVFSYPITKLLTTVGAYIFSGIALAIFVGLIIDYVNTEKEKSSEENKTIFDFSQIEEFNIEEPKKISKEQHAKTIAKQKLGLEKGETTIISSSMPTYNIDTTVEKKPLSKRDYILTPLEPIIPSEDNWNKAPQQSANINTYNQNNYQKPKLEEYNTNLAEEIRKPENIQPIYNAPQQEKTYTYEKVETVEETSSNDDFILDEDEIDSSYETAFETDTTLEEPTTQAQQPTQVSTMNADEELFEDLNDEYEEINSNEENITKEISVQEITPDLDKHEFVDNFEQQNKDEFFGNTVETEVVRPSAVNLSKFNLPNQVKKDVVVEETKPAEPIKLEIPPYVAPPADLLNYMENPARISDEELQDNIERLEQVLEDFKVPAKVNNVQVGPAVTRYELTMPRGISVNKIAQMSDDIAMTLASNGSIRVEAPIPGKNSVGIEVPNAQVSPVSLRELVESDEFKQRGNPLSFVLGKDINGDIIFCNLDKMPHLLVAGSTGSGKSVCLNTMLLSMCYKAGPQDLRLILVDPKMVEFTTYNGLPHLLIPEVIIGKNLTINALDWSIKEMERRYALFAKNHVVNINEFNKSDLVKSGQEQKLPFIVIVVDELADLMLEAKREIEDRIAKLAAKARAAGIHLVLATQRPSVDVITGTVKANLPSRIAFALTNYMDSKTVLDGGGAEKLLGKGDMLFKPQDKPEPRRVQGAFVSNSEIAAVVDFIKQNNKPVYDEGAGKAIKNPQSDKPTNSDGGAGARDLEFDPVLKEALHMFIQTKQASGSMISRRFSVGFNRAGRIMDQMERAGFIGPQEGSKPRQVLITMDEYNAIFNDNN